MRVHKKIGSTSRLMEVFNKVNNININEVIIGKDEHKGVYYENPNYNGGQKEIIKLPISISSDLLYNTEYEFTLELTGGSDERVELFFNGNFGDFLLIVAGNGRTYLAHLNEKDYLELKNKYSSEEQNIENNSIQEELGDPWDDNGEDEMLDAQTKHNRETPNNIKKRILIKNIKKTDYNDHLITQLPFLDDDGTAMKSTIQSISSPEYLIQWRNKFIKKYGYNGELVLDNWGWSVQGNKGYDWAIKESVNESNVNNEIGTDSGIFQMLLAYVTKNRITEVEFQVGELTVQIIANPTTWDESSYMGATHMQPEEGGYPENVQGEISDIVIWDREDNEYTLSNDALQRLNQNVQFDGHLLDDITEKAANNGGEDEHNHADFTRKSSLENEGVESNISNVPDVKYKYVDGKYIPIGYEDKRVALRVVKNKILGVILDQNGDDEDYIFEKELDDWQGAMDALWDSFN